MFQFQHAYKESLPNAIRDDFASITDDYLLDPQTLLDKLAAYVPTDTLRNFMNDLAMDRV